MTCAQCGKEFTPHPTTLQKARKTGRTEIFCSNGCAQRHRGGAARGREQEILEAYEREPNAELVGRRFGITGTTVRNVVRKLGGKLRQVSADTIELVCDQCNARFTIPT